MIPLAQITAAGRPLLFIDGRCVAAPPDLATVGEEFDHVAARLRAAGVTVDQVIDGNVPADSLRTEPSQVAPEISARSSRHREGENATDIKTRSGKLVSSSAVCRRLRLGKARLVQAIKGGLLKPDFVTDSGLVLFRPARLHAISRKLKSKTYRLK